jgi:transposase
MKPYVKTNKNDFNDAEAIAEAATRATMRFVPLKTTEQLELQASHRIRRRLVHERMAVALLLEYGLVTPRGRETFARRWSQILGTASDQLSPRLFVLIQRVREHWVALDGQIAEATQELTAWADTSPLCQRVERARRRPDDRHRARLGRWGCAHVCARPRHGCVARPGPAPAVHRRDTHVGPHESTREWISSTARLTERRLRVSLDEA